MRTGPNPEKDEASLRATASEANLIRRKNMHIGHLNVPKPDLNDETFFMTFGLNFTCIIQDKLRMKGLVQ